MAVAFVQSDSDQTRVPAWEVEHAMNSQQRKRSKAKREYAAAGPDFLAAHIKCEIEAPGCWLWSTERSHIVGTGRNGGVGYTDPENWEGACAPCGQYVEHEKAWALSTGHHFHAWEYEPGQMRTLAIEHRAARNDEERWDAQEGN